MNLTFHPNSLKKEEQIQPKSRWKKKVIKTRAETNEIETISKFGKLSSGHRTGKVSFHSNPKERQCQRMFRLPHNCTHLTGKVMLKVLQIRLLQYVNHEFPDVQAGFIQGQGTRDQIANICRIKEKAREFQKTSASLTMLKPLFGSQQTVENS